MKKIIGFLMITIMLLSIPNVAFASENIPVLSIEKNQLNSNGERHIKVNWSGSYRTYKIQIDDDSNFKSPITKTRSSKQGCYYNFVLDKNVEATYYIRVGNGKSPWSNVVVASMEDKIGSESKPYFSIPKIQIIPNITNSVKLPKITFNK